MEHENFSIRIDGQEVQDLYPDLRRLEVELDEDLAAQFRLQLALDRHEDGTWRYLDDERLQVWRRVAISAGFESGTEELISGFITHLRPVFDPDPAHCTLEVWGMDRSVLLDRQDKLKAWPNKTDSSIAAEIFSEVYALAAEVEDTKVAHDEAVSTIIQRETDMQFLRRLAARNGFECYVEGDTGYFRPPQLDKPPQPVLAVHFGPGETNVAELALEVNALAPAEVKMQQIDRVNKEVLEVDITSGQQRTLGKNGSADLLPRWRQPKGARQAFDRPTPEIDAGLVMIGRAATTGTPEMTRLCQGVYDQAEWFVTGEGQVNANNYRHVLRPRRTVTIKGIGETYSGIYYVTHVTHVLAPSGYTQHFRVKRNALMPSGMENFASSPDR